MIGLARIAGPVACLGLTLLLLARTRRDRLAGLGFAVLGACMLAASLAPHDYAAGREDYQHDPKRIAQSIKSSDIIHD